jgi:hypothetical protein
MLAGADCYDCFLYSSGAERRLFFGHVAFDFVKAAFVCNIEGGFILIMYVMTRLI